MTENMKKINDTFKLISSMQVYGDNVDLIAAARTLLRSVYHDMEQQENEAKADTVNDHE